jgi:MFS family permease
VKQTFIFALGLFTVASALCAGVDSLGELIAMRVLQGAGAGMMTPSGTAMLYRTFPPERRAQVARTVIVPILVGPGSAPILGGALTEWFSWRWIFLINVPAGVAVVLFAWRFLPRTPQATTGRLDFLGMLLSGLAVRGERRFGARLGVHTGGAKRHGGGGSTGSVYAMVAAQ